MERGTGKERGGYLLCLLSHATEIRSFFFLLVVFKVTCDSAEYLELFLCVVFVAYVMG